MPHISPSLTVICIILQINTFEKTASLAKDLLCKHFCYSATLYMYAHKEGDIHVIMMPCLLQATPTSGRAEQHLGSDKRLRERCTPDSAGLDPAYIWERWCSDRHGNPVSPSVGTVVDFLADMFDSGREYLP